MTPIEIITIAQILVTFGRQAALDLVALLQRAQSDDKPTRAEVLSWLQPLDYARAVPNSVILNPPQ